MDDVYVYMTRLPDGIYEIVTPCADGYTVWIDDRLGSAEMADAYEHALWHIRNGDFERSDVQEIEYHAHERKQP